MENESTKPRKPIAAMHSSPGPCYGLPQLTGDKAHDPRSVHRKQPAYPFGVRHGEFKDDCSPGPCHYVGKVYRDGTDGTPHYSLCGRQKDPAVLTTPGPGAYSPEAAGNTTYFHHPAYSFGTRHRDRSSDNTPAPNCYTLDTTYTTTTRRGPSYSMVGRHTNGSFAEDLAGTPGPGTYTTTDPSIYRNRHPMYSLGSRNVMPGDNTQKPGPGQHSPEEVAVNRRSAPRFSFGTRHSNYEVPLIVEGDD